MKFKVVELIPYSTFKERLKIIKEYDQKAKADNYLEMLKKADSYEPED